LVLNYIKDCRSILEEIVSADRTNNNNKMAAPFENLKWPPAIIIVHWTICNGHYPDLGTFLL
jgi:hypothetical protein